MIVSNLKVLGLSSFIALSACQKKSGGDSVPEETEPTVSISPEASLLDNLAANLRADLTSAGVDAGVVESIVKAGTDKASTLFLSLLGSKQSVAAAFSSGASEAVAKSDIPVEQKKAAATAVVDSTLSTASATVDASEKQELQKEITQKSVEAIITHGKEEETQTLVGAAVKGAIDAAKELGVTSEDAAKNVSSAVIAALNSLGIPAGKKMNDVMGGLGSGVTEGLVSSGKTAQEAATLATESVTKAVTEELSEDKRESAKTAAVNAVVEKAVEQETDTTKREAIIAHVQSLVPDVAIENASDNSVVGADLCDVGLDKVNYSFQDMDGDGQMVRVAGYLCLKNKSLPEGYAEVYTGIEDCDDGDELIVTRRANLKKTTKVNEQMPWQEFPPPPSDIWFENISSEMPLLCVVDGVAGDFVDDYMYRRLNTSEYSDDNVSGYNIYKYFNAITINMGNYIDYLFDEDRNMVRGMGSQSKILTVDDFSGVKTIQFSESEEVEITTKRTENITDHLADKVIDVNYPCVVLEKDGENVKCLFDNNFVAQNVFTTIHGIENAIKIKKTIGGNNACAVLSDGTAKCFGQNYNGQLGNGTKNNIVIPTFIQTSENVPLTGIIDLAMGDTSSCAVLTGGVLKCWGSNSQQQLGNSQGELLYASELSTTITSGVTKVSMSGPSNTTCAIANGIVKCWGVNYIYGKVGVNSTDSYFATPQDVCESEDCSTKLTDIIDLDSTQESSCAVKSSGEVYCWGFNEGYGNLGDGGVNNYLLYATKTTVFGDNIAKKVVKSQKNTIILTESGDVYVAGDNSVGQRGNGTISQNAHTETAIKTLTSGANKLLSVNGYSICVINESDKLVCWGQDMSHYFGVGRQAHLNDDKTDTADPFDNTAPFGTRKLPSPAGVEKKADYEINLRIIQR